MVERQKKWEKKMSDGFIHVEDENGLIKKAKISEVKRSDKIIKCLICANPATHVDRLHPYETFDDRCDEHFGKLIDLTTYNNYGIGILVSKEHFDMSDIHEKMNQMAGWLNDQSDDESKQLHESFCDVLRKIDSYVPKKWPNELFGPKEN